MGGSKKEQQGYFFKPTHLVFINISGRSFTEWSL